MIKMALFEALYGRRCRNSIYWEEVGDMKLMGPKLVLITIEKVKVINEKIKATQDR